MNERFKDLALECIVENIAAPAWVFTDAEFDKFAELIVKECVDIANKNRTAMEMDRNTHLTADAIKEHFGVEG